MCAVFPTIHDTMGLKLLMMAMACILLPCFIGARTAIHSNRIVDSHSTCFPELGCFRHGPPFNNTDWMPNSPSYIGTAFLLYTRQNPRRPQRLVADRSSSIADSHFVGSRPTKILVHGFLQRRSDDFLLNMTRALLDEADVNVIIVGWSRGARFPYGQAVANTRVVGAQIAQLVSAIASQTGADLRRVHIIGHSLGAHVAGYAGARLPGLGRITGLDPAQPSYHGFSTEVRLDPSDAHLVDVIHTDGLQYDDVHGYGMIEPVGHMDFYPNGGHSQPGCRQDNSYMDVFGDMLRHGLTTAERDISCSHERSTTLFIASISSRTTCSFQAFPCNSEESFAKGECSSCGNIPCPVMGYHANMYSRARGVFYLNTTATPPFCGHHHFVNLTLSDSMTSAFGKLQVKLVGERGETGWTDMKSGYLNPGEVLSKVMVSQNHIGDMTRMEVRFSSTAGFFSWSSHEILLQRAKVMSHMPGHLKYLCMPNMLLSDGGSVSLTGWSYTETEC